MSMLDCEECWYAIVMYLVIILFLYLMTIPIHSFVFLCAWWSRSCVHPWNIFLWKTFNTKSWRDFLDEWWPLFLRTLKLCFWLEIFYGKILIPYNIFWCLIMFGRSKLTSGSIMDSLEKFYQHIFLPVVK